LSGAGWFVRAFEPGDERGILELWESVVGRPLRIDEWRWKFGRSVPPASDGYVWVAQTAERDRIIGHYGGIPRTIRFGHRTAQAIVIVDSMTAPDFRGRGVFSALTSAAHSSWSRAGVGLLLGMPNDNAQRATQWRPLFELYWWRRILRVDEILSRPGSLTKLRSVVAKPAYWRARRTPTRARPDDISALDTSRDGAALETLASRTGAEASNYLLRPEAWFQWRFSESGAREYQVQGVRRDRALRAAIAWSITERGGRRANVAELLVDPDDNQAAIRLLDSVVHDLYLSGTGTVSTLAPARGHVADVLRSCGFRRRSVGFTIAAIALDAGPDLEQLTDGASWYVSGADFDVA